MDPKRESGNRPFVLVCTDYVRTGGQDIANFALADYLARKGREVHVVGHRFDPDLDGHASAHLHRVPKLARSTTLSAPLLTAMGLVQYLAHFKERPHVISNGGNCPSPSANWVHYLHAAYQPSSKIFATRLLQAYSHPVSRMTELLALRASRIVIANSERTRADVIERIGISADRVKTIYYGIDPTRFPAVTPEARRNAATALGWSPDQFRALFIGALGDRRKGFDKLFEAWRALSTSPHWDGQLIVVGAGAELDEWKRRAAEDRLEASISFLGFRSDVPRIMQACDILVAPTRYEAYGLGVHEALCVGLPAIVSARSGVAERYPEALKSLLLDDPESTAELVDRLRHARESGTRLRREIEKLGDKLRSWTWDDMAREIESTCDSALA